MKTLMIEVRDISNIECLKQYGAVTFIWNEMNYVEMYVSEEVIKKIEACSNVITCEISKKGKYQPLSLCTAK